MLIAICEKVSYGTFKINTDRVNVFQLEGVNATISEIGGKIS